jgi:hypothetical protein
MTNTIDTDRGTTIADEIHSCISACVVWPTDTHKKRGMRFYPHTPSVLNRPGQGPLKAFTAGTYAPVSASTLVSSTLLDISCARAL